MYKCVPDFMQDNENRATGGGLIYKSCEYHIFIGVGGLCEQAQDEQDHEGGINVRLAFDKNLLTGRRQWYLESKRPRPLLV